jgi:hypothetical protein
MSISSRRGHENLGIACVLSIGIDLLLFRALFPRGLSPWVSAEVSHKPERDQCGPQYEKRKIDFCKPALYGEDDYPRQRDQDARNPVCPERDLTRDRVLRTVDRVGSHSGNSHRSTVPIVSPTRPPAVKNGNAVERSLA